MKMDSRGWRRERLYNRPQVAATVASTRTLFSWIATKICGHPFKIRVTRFLLINTRARRKYLDTSVHEQLSGTFCWHRELAMMKGGGERRTNEEE